MAKGGEEGSGTLTLEGFNVLKVSIDPETFPAWCKANGFEMDGKARTQYTLGIAMVAEHDLTHRLAVESTTLASTSYVMDRSLLELEFRERRLSVLRGTSGVL
ncbi:MAG: hypothetical protein ACLQU1_03170 [Bryobacteraceae bacterium]